MDDIILAFGAFLAGFLSTLFAVILDVVIEGNRLRTDEAALKVGVNNAGRFRGGIALMNRPGACRRSADRAGRKPRGSRG